MTVLLKGISVSALLLFVHTAAWAQATAQITGTVRDESGAVLPGVTVTATQTDTGFMRTSVTEGTGVFVMPNLPTGPYRMEATLQGFRSYVRTGIVLQVGAAPVINPVLAIGELEESVTVEAAAPLIDVQSAGISEVVEQERILELPLQGRQVTDLIVLAGAAVNTGQVAGSRNRNDSVAISVAGGMRTGVAYTLDGAMHNDNYDNLNMPFPFPDALQEFQVATGGLSAENGMHSGGSVNAVTKSGTNRFSGNVFEFLRHHRFNATDPFASVGPDGTRNSDGLVRNQYGATVGGPAIGDRLFFFGGYQGTTTRQNPAANIAWVPTAAMLAGDFTQFASPACNGGQQVALRAPFVNNRVDPALLSPAALAIARQLPATTNPCGEIAFSVPLDNNDWQAVARVDYQATANQSIFARYMDTVERRLPSLTRTGNVLTVRPVYGTNKRLSARSMAAGHTLVLGSSIVNSLRVTWNSGGNHLNDPPEQFFDAPSLGIDLHTYVPGTMAVNVTDGFAFSGGQSVRVAIDKAAYQVSDQLTVVRGRHQMAFGGNLANWMLDSTDYAHSNGTFDFRGRRTGRGLADFLTGQLDRLQHGAPSIIDMRQWYVGLFAQDAWRTTDRVTLNVGVRWEPYLGQSIENGAISNFSLENFRQRIRTGQFENAPAGLLYPGDPGFEGLKGINTQWLNLSPRAGVAWDVAGDGRTAVRSSYAMSYDFPTSQFMYKPATGTPFSNRLLLTGRLAFDDPYADYPGGQPHPIQQPPPPDALFPAFAQFLPIDPDINSTRVQSWNVTVERELGSGWMASASYLGSYIDRIWGGVQMNPGVFMGLGPCTIHGVRYSTCTTDNNLNERRVLYLEDPVEGQGMSYVTRIADVGEQAYRGLKLSFRHRAATGVSLSGNYTLSHCEADTYFSGGWFQFEEGYLRPDDPTFDRGNCVSNRSQVGNLSVSATTPEFTSAALRAVASDWRVAGILSARSGGWLTVTTTRDIAGTGIDGQRVNQVRDNAYGDKTLTNYLDRAAFAHPAAGTLGDHRNNSIEGPGFWTVDLAISRLVDFGGRPGLELRVEVFNLLNNFNWDDPQTNFDSGNFGRITSNAGSPRIMQFGVKYGF
jgi:hypothetical protein